MNNEEYTNLWHQRQNLNKFIEDNFYGIEIEDLDLNQLINFVWYLDALGKLMEIGNNKIAQLSTFDFIWNKFSIDVNDFDFETIYQLADNLKEIIKIEKEMEKL